MSYKNNDANEQVEKKSQWGRCCAPCCDIPPSVSAGGNQYCTYHNGHEFEEFEPITQAIKNNMQHYNYMLTLMRWDNKRWATAWNTVANYHFCPLIQGEQVLPHRYIDRLSKHLRLTIKQEAGV